MSKGSTFAKVGVALGVAGILYVVHKNTKGATRKSKPRKPLPPSGSIAGYEYEIVPLNGATSKSPVVIAFHGLGGTVNGTKAMIAPLIDKPVQLIVARGKNKYGTNRAWWTERAGEDQQVLTDQMSWVADDFRPFLQEVKKAYGTPVLTGHSQGGMMSALLASRHPKLVRSAVASAAWVPPGLWNTRPAPMTLVHGTQDDTVAFERSKEWALAMQNAGGAVEFVEIPGQGHGFVASEHGQQLRKVLS